MYDFCDVTKNQTSWQEMLSCFMPSEKSSVQFFFFLLFFYLMLVKKLNLQYNYTPMFTTNMTKSHYHQC